MLKVSGLPNDFEVETQVGVVWGCHSAHCCYMGRTHANCLMRMLSRTRCASCFWSYWLPSYHHLATFGWCCQV